MLIFCVQPTAYCLLIRGSFMKRWNLLAAACAMGLAWEVPLVSAAPQPPIAKATPAPAALGLDAAKKALAEKRYDDVDRVLDLTGYLIDTFPDPERIDKVHSMVAGAAEAFVFGKDPKERYLKPLAVLTKHAAKDVRWIELLAIGGRPATDDAQRVQF